MDYIEDPAILRMLEFWHGVVLRIHFSNIDQYLFLDKIKYSMNNEGGA